MGESGNVGERHRYLARPEKFARGLLGRTDGLRFERVAQLNKEQLLDHRPYLGYAFTGQLVGGLREFDLSGTRPHQSLESYLPHDRGGMTEALHQRTHHRNRLVFIDTHVDEEFGVCCRLRVGSQQHGRVRILDSG